VFDQGEKYLRSNLL